MPFSPDVPYNDLPDLPPPGELETKHVLKQLVTSRAALAALAESLAHLPDAALLTNSIVIQEAKDSSEIENIVTTHDELYTAIALDSQLFETSETKEVKRYREALRIGEIMLQERGIMNTVLADRINAELVGYNAGVRRTPGTTLKNARTGVVVYTPPEGLDLLNHKLDSLWRYLGEATQNDTDPLVQLALLHYQFEAIHPYIDGNGRSGRILNVLYLTHTGLLPRPVLYMSGYIIRTKGEYYDLLRAVTSEGRWEDWIVYMLRVIERTAQDSMALVSAIRILRADLTVAIRTTLPRMRNVHGFTEVLFSQPYSRIEFFVSAGIGNRKTISAYLNALESQGILRSRRVGVNTLFLNLPLYRLLAGEE